MVLVDGEFAGFLSGSNGSPWTYRFRGTFVGDGTIIYLARVYGIDDEFLGQIKGSFLRRDISGDQVRAKVTRLVEAALESTPDPLKFSHLRPGYPSGRFNSSAVPRDSSR